MTTPTTARDLASQVLAQTSVALLSGALPLPADLGGWTWNPDPDRGIRLIHPARRLATGWAPPAEAERLIAEARAEQLPPQFAELPADLAGWQWERSPAATVRLALPTDGHATRWWPPTAAPSGPIEEARAIVAREAALVAEVEAIVAPQSRMQRHIDRTLAADRKGGEALWEKALAVADARAEATKGGEWGAYLEATGQHERAARRLVAIAERGRSEARFRDAIISGWLTFSVGAIAAQADDDLLSQLLDQPTPPTRAQLTARPDTGVRSQSESALAPVAQLSPPRPGNVVRSEPAPVPAAPSTKATDLPCPVPAADLAAAKARAQALGGDLAWWGCEFALWEVVDGKGSHSKYAGSDWPGLLRRIEHLEQTVQQAPTEGMLPGDAILGPITLKMLAARGWELTGRVRNTEEAGGAVCTYELITPPLASGGRNTVWKNRSGIDAIIRFPSATATVATPHPDALPPAPPHARGLADDLAALHNRQQAGMYDEADVAELRRCEARLDAEVEALDDATYESLSALIGILRAWRPEAEPETPQDAAPPAPASSPAQPASVAQGGAQQADDLDALYTQAERGPLAEILRLSPQALRYLSAIQFGGDAEDDDAIISDWVWECLTNGAKELSDAQHRLMLRDASTEARRAA